MFGKKLKAPEPTTNKEKTTVEATLGTTNLIVNPTSEMQLRRCKSRLHRVNLFLSLDKCVRGSRQELEHQTIKRRLELQIKLMEGDF